MEPPDPPAQASNSPQRPDAASPDETSPVSITPNESLFSRSCRSSESSQSSLHRSRGGGRRSGHRDPRKGLGRKAFSRRTTDRRRDDEQAPKRQKTEDGEGLIPIYATQFSQEDIEADQRRPKKKAAVLMSYSGTGYRGMQMTTDQKTIEGELFPAFVAAEAISKANAADPKKSSFVRCARTDKGVHAAGNVVSLKLILEDPDVVKKINEHLGPQIRVWGIETTTKGFSSYQSCDSRIYEYLIPSHCFIPPHPSTYLAKKLRESAQEKGEFEEYDKRQDDIRGYWEEVDKDYIKPILERLPEEMRKEVQDSLCIREGDPEHPVSSTSTKDDGADNKGEDTKPKTLSVPEALNEIRSAYFKAKEAYRIHPDRIARINEALALYVGTRNFHNYTIKKTWNEASAKRVIKSFKVSGDPILINGTEWLSLKVHGQSFMMHQIRKMVAMAALVVRCGTPLERITQSYGPEKIAIPKAPGLGLLLERPIFDIYGHKAKRAGKNPIDFSKYQKEIDEFKQREIYERIFREEDEAKAFGNFFNHVDTFPEDTFMYVTSGGISAALATAPNEKKADTNNTKALAEVESESEDEVVNEGEEGG